MKQNLSILAVDDTLTDMAVLIAMLEDMGHTVVQARSGEEALDLFRQRQPDLVLMDVIMPGMGGNEAVCEMRRIAREWLPIIFVTAMGQPEDVVRGIEAGGDDYLLKPIDFKILQAKINSLSERLRLNRQLAEQNKMLLEFQVRHEAEHRIASGHMQQMVARDTLQEPAVEIYLKPAGNFCGDMVAKARTPDGRLHLMLADSTGHGLTAALAALPIILPFYAMTEKDFGIAAIAREMNKMMWRSLPSDHFVAAILVSIYPQDQKIEVWSGGCPPPLVLNSKGHEVYQFSPRHLAMGILPDEQFDATLECYVNQDRDDCCLLMFSDGVVELENQNGEHFDRERLLRVSRSLPVSERWKGLIAAIEDFSAANKFAHDDIAMMMVRCMQVQNQVRYQVQGQLAWQFEFSLSTQQLKKLDVVPLLLNMILQIEREKEHRGKLFLILSELFCNALEHGLLKLDSALKRDADGMEKYFDERARRLADLQAGKIDFNLKKMEYCGGNSQLIIHVRDSGDGFDYQREREKIAAETVHCGGVALLDKMCSSVQYLGNGSEVQVCFDMPARV